MGDLWGRIWRWITDNAAALGAVGAIAAVVVAIYFGAAAPQTPGNTTTVSGVGNVVGSNNSVTVNNGLTLKDALALVEAQVAHWQGLTREQEQTIREQERQLGVNQGTFQSFFAILQEKNVLQEQWPAKLVEIAERHMALRKQVQSIPVNDGRILELKQKVEAAIADGHHDVADDLLAQVLELQGVEMAAAWGSRGELAMTRLRYADAAHHFASAANALPPTQGARKLAYLEREAAAWNRQGDEFGDNAALEKSIELYKKLLEAYPRGSTPDDWARIQNNLGNALQVLGGRESDTTRLEEAVQAYREALKEWTQARVPLKWAMTQNNLGAALSRLGDRESGTTRLEEAVQAYREALKVRTQARVSLGWAGTQNNLGIALRSLGERESGTTRLEEAMVAVQNALRVAQESGASHFIQVFESNLQEIRALLAERKGKS